MLLFNKKSSLQQAIPFIKVFIRLLITSVCGWLFAATDHHWDALNHVLQYDFPFVAFGVGVAAALTVHRRNKYLISLTICTGLLALIGWGAYWLPITSQADALNIAYCEQHYCHVAGLNTFQLEVTWFIDVILVLIGSLVTIFIIKPRSKG